MKKTLLLLLTLFTLTSQAQSDQKFNLGFEKQKSKEELPDAWHKWGTYALSTEADSYEGQLATKITSTEGGSGFGAIVYKIPANYEGKSIRLEGYMKIKAVENGHAGLLLRIDGKERGEILEFDNMKNQNISGTVDWKKYTITLNYPKGAETIYVGGILVGKGELYLDDLVLTIDGKDVQTLKEKEKILLKADLDKEFDKAS
ncbi:MAG TPA: peptidase S41, partial [Bacteroidetes bacterium]|nr:peptidase S41 [Bacteroidota bacterium]